MLSHFSCVQLLATPWTVALQAPLPTGFSRQEYWVGCHALLQGIFPTGIKPMSPVFPALQVDSLPAEPTGTFFNLEVSDHDEH